MTGSSTARRALALVLIVPLLVGAGTAEQAERFDGARAAFDSASAAGDRNHPGFVEAFEAWSALVEEEHVESYYHLGMMNLFGLGGARFDQRIGIERVRHAAEGGYYPAQSLMGFMAETGDGVFVRRDDGVARDWYALAAEAGHCVAMRRLAKAYANGELGLAVDAQVSERWVARQSECKRR